jgi:sec-independent protein translocase protein TatB
MDSFFGIGIGELFFIAVIALIVLGPERLPGALREVAKFMRTIRSMTNELTSQFGDEIKALDDLNPQKILRELTEDPDEKAKAAKAATTTKPAAKPATKPTTSSTTKPATPKPATPKPTTSTTSTTTKPATSKPAVTPKSTTVAATSKTAVKPVTEDAVATVEEVAVAVEEAPVAEKSTAEAATLDAPVQDVAESASPELAAPTIDTLAVDAALAETAQAEMVEAPVVPDEEYSILPPARAEEAHVGVYPFPGDPPADESPPAAMAAEESVATSAPETSPEEISSVEEVASDATTELSAEISMESAPVVDPETLLRKFQAKQLLNQPVNQSANLNGARVNGTNTENEP